MAAMEFGYDYSRLQRTREVVVAADFTRHRGDPEALRAVARESLAFRKRTQPLESPAPAASSRIPDPARDLVPDGIPWSAGALVDRAGLKDARAGRGARLADARQLHRQRGRRQRRVEIRGADRAMQGARCRRRFGVRLREEIVYLGFGRGRSKELNGNAED